MRSSLPCREHPSFLIAMAALIALALQGCGTTEQEVQTIVRDAVVSGPVFSPPVNVVSDNSREKITFSAYAGTMRAAVLTGIVDGSEPARSAWLYPGDTVQVAGGGRVVQKVVPDHNLSWQQSSFSAGARLDFAWKSVALSLGAGLSNSTGTIHGNWSAGLGIFSSDSSTVRARFDLGVFGQSLSYSARTVTITTTTSSWWFGESTQTIDTAYYHDKADVSAIGYYGSLMLNTAKSSWPANFFLQGSFVVQPVLSYKPYTKTTVDWLMFVPVGSESGRGDVSTDAFFVGITPGIYIEPSPNLIVAAGVKCLFETSGTFSGQTSLFIPFVQVGLRTGL
jgi:hypothetical protein